MLALLLLAQQVLAGVNLPEQVSRQAHYELRQVPSCPDVGYTLLREPGLNSVHPGSCVLCFCQENSTALCWRTQNRRCDQESYQHHISKRIKRSPIGLSDIFFRDAARDVFDKQNPEQCKPFEGSYSEGCPPDDWCIGCTVCDCDANGRWDCHILSFCDDKKGKTQVKKRKGPYRRTKVRKGKKTTTKKATFVTPLPLKKMNNKLANKSADKTKPINKQTPRRKLPPAKKPQPARKPQKPDNKNKKVAPTIKKVTPKPTKKNDVRKPNNNNAANSKKTSPRGPQKKTDPKKVDPKKVGPKKTNNPTQIAPEAMQQVMDAVKKMITKHNNKTTQAYKKVTKAQQDAVQKMAAEVQKMALAQKPKKHKKKSNKNKMIYNYKNKKAVVADYPPPRRQKRELIFGTKYQFVNGTGNQKYRESNKELYVTKNQVNNPQNLTQTIIRSTYKPEITVHYADHQDYYKYTVDYNLNDKKTLNKPANVKQRKMPEKDVFMNLVDNMLSGVKITKVSQGTIYKDIGNRSRSKEIYNLYSKELLTEKNENYKINQKLDKNENINKKVHLVVKTVNDANDGKKTSYVKDIEQSKAKKVKSLYKSNEVQEVLKTLLRDMTSNTTRSPIKSRKFSIIKYFKRLFKNYFTRTDKKEKSRTRYGNNSLNRRHIIGIICKNIGPCRVTAKNRLHLKHKINELNSETKKILRIINVIKGLLHLLDVPYKSQDTEGSMNNSVFNNDGQKLNAILKDSYIDGGRKLTQTQLSQINYVKENTKDFIKCVGRFATILHEIINLLQTDTYNMRGRHKKDPLRNFKALIFKYNLVQNSFMHKMYQLLGKFDASSSIDDSNQKVSEHRELNNTVAIENISRSIIKNLRKLKNLAQALNSSRKKRHVRRDNDDAMEYLLTLMEYLLKQNYPLDAAPENDGIDLLIDAIKNAPDIKTIKKKVLDNMSNTATTTRIPKNNNETPDISRYESYKIQEEHNNMRKFNELSIHKGPNIDDGNDENIYNTKVPTTTASTAYVYYNKIVDDDETYPESTTQYPIPTAITYVPEPLEKENPKASQSTDKAEQVKIVANKIYEEDENAHRNYKDERKRDKGNDIGEVRQFEVYTSEAENDETTTNESTTTEGTEVIIGDVTSTETTTEPKVELKIRRHSSSSNEVSSETKRPKLEWIEDDIGKELKIDYINSDQGKTTMEPTEALTTTIAATARTLVAQKRVDISGIPEEIADKYPVRTKTTRMSPEEVMYKKQMDLLNSLDYDTARPEFDDAGSKDVSEVTDTFPSYFG